MKREELDQTIRNLIHNIFSATKTTFPAGGTVERIMLDNSVALAVDTLDNLNRIATALEGIERNTRPQQYATDPNQRDFFQNKPIPG